MMIPLEIVSKPPQSNAKAQRQAAKKKNEETEHRQLALMRAKAAAFGIMNQILSGEECPAGWKYYAAGNHYAAQAVDVASSSDRCVSNLTIKTEFGIAILNNFNGSLVGSVTNRGGWHPLFFTKDQGRTNCWAAGVSGDQSLAVEVCGVSIGFFPQNQPSPSFSAQ